MTRTVSNGSAAEVVMVVPRTDGHILLMTKAFYPENVHRLPSGKIHGSEHPEEALHRELHEETGFRLDIERHLGRLDYVFHFADQRVSFASHVYLMQPTDDEPQTLDAEEQITDFTYIPLPDLRIVADRLRKLEQSWHDWGRFRAIAHDFTADVISAC